MNRGGGGELGLRGSCKNENRNDLNVGGGMTEKFYNLKLEQKRTQSKFNLSLFETNLFGNGLPGFILVFKFVTQTLNEYSFIKI